MKSLNRAITQGEREGDRGKTWLQVYQKKHKFMHVYMYLEIYELLLNFLNGILLSSGREQSVGIATLHTKHLDGSLGRGAGGERAGGECVGERGREGDNVLTMPTILEHCL